MLLDVVALGLQARGKPFSNLSLLARYGVDPGEVLVESDQVMSQAGVVVAVMFFSDCYGAVIEVGDGKLRENAGKRELRRGEQRRDDEASHLALCSLMQLTDETTTRLLQRLTQVGRPVMPYLQPLAAPPPLR